ncbi:hypothetical protein NE639_26485, partial [Blautia producta]|nr:hypothetical protein [Blautia producta]
MEQFLEKSGLTYDAQIIYSVLLCKGDGEIAPGILRRPRPLKIPFVRFLSDDVSLLSKPRAIMAR